MRSQKKKSMISLKMTNLINDMSENDKFDKSPSPGGLSGPCTSSVKISLVLASSNTWASLDAIGFSPSSMAKLYRRRLCVKSYFGSPFALQGNVTKAHHLPIRSTIIV
ncbi:hypothetical protein Bca4012_043636 [Brassica carinata]|uniref:Uncharacterized protein n=2 Tax=Brassica TaxID=3705 RepID=A0A3P6DVN6_BRAOL|nr:unnamed protein product [Brassica napus]CDY67627.1 BnaCnng55720D [Brassica napus]VDD30908.1 unnamed protein product [Brassica oleracea]